MVISSVKLQVKILVNIFILILIVFWDAKYNYFNKTKKKYDSEKYLYLNLYDI